VPPELEYNRTIKDRTPQQRRSKMTKLKVGDIVRFKENQSRWIVDSIWHGGEIVHLELENGGGPAYAIPVKSLVKLS